jgi:hypothetical protein
MFTILCFALTLLATLTAYRFTRRRRRRERRCTVPDVLAQAFPAREMRELDAHLEEIALHELLRLEREVARYLTGTVGYVVTISKSTHGIALDLSDGRRLTLAGVSSRTLQLLIRRTSEDMLLPAHVHRDVFSYRLRLRGRAGADFDIHARKIALAH